VLELWPGTRVFRLPEDLPAERAVFIEPVACAVRGILTAIQTAGPLARRRLAVVGFGPLGLAVSAVAVSHGADVLVIDPDPERRKMAVRLGLAIALPEQLGEPDEWRAGRGFEVAVESAGSPEAFTLATRIVRYGGTVVEMGNFASQLAARPGGRSAPAIRSGAEGSVTANEICQRDLRVSGVSETRDGDFHDALAIVTTTPLDLGCAVTRVVEWPDVGDLDALFGGIGQFKQIVRFEGGARQ
jgi:threonine dehydrogenase-like Zn-dependent dehydrogenase